MLKPKQYDVEDSNVEGIGSDEDRNLRKKAAQTEPAWRRWEKYLNGSILNSGEEFEDKGCKHHVEIWRIEKFKVKFWPREKFGHFHTGDSYLILHTYQVKEEGKEKLCWDLHFWLGTETTQDEMGTAAYKTVELDTLLDDGPVQYREVQDAESDRFKNLFDYPACGGGLFYEAGGVDTGFRHVEPEKYVPRLMHVKGTNKRVKVKQVEMKVSSLNSGDIFLLDLGLKILSWKGSQAGMHERNKGRELCDALKTERKGKSQIVYLNEGDFQDPDYIKFFEMLGGRPTDKIKSAEEGGKDDAPPEYGPSSLWRLSDSSGDFQFTKEAEGSAISMDLLDTKDVFVLDAGYSIFVWVGKGATKNEKNNAIPYATKYLNDNNRPLSTPIGRVLEGAETKEFKQALGK